MAERRDLQIFGLPIEVLPTNEYGVPFFLPVVINRLLEHVQEVGLFRRCGNHLTIERMGTEALDVTFTIREGVTTHDVASFLKQWLRELPDPIVTPKIVNEYYVSETLESARAVLSHLLPVNRKSFAMICAILQLVADQSEVNLMTLSNLFVCILPSITQSNKDVTVKFKFGTFFKFCIELMNPDGNDFVL
ncbi:RhoGAP domain containing protein [Tritrichomonas foetus]|uniref:RhoGAP domain containing protein n=1 Tax=Tritrichomonas foetus TaxID=1144522 RepID=A0A1J4KNB7_9EUKA|nr:RhoGAP domain containing protein [Tritrichomonas foetus]|eukprot:OHT12807.1 RhoGAP domain containing protein [Tritrichomonas foetus]